MNRLITGEVINQERFPLTSPATSPGNKRWRFKVTNVPIWTIAAENVNQSRLSKRCLLKVIEINDANYNGDDHLLRLSAAFDLTYCWRL